MDNWKEAYDELVHKHLKLKEKYEEIEHRKYTDSDMWSAGWCGFLIAVLLVIVFSAIVF